jgi:hypothetical protein
MFMPPGNFIAVHLSSTQNKSCRYAYVLILTFRRRECKAASKINDECGMMNDE